MPKRPKIPPSLRRQVMVLDRHRCAYCRSPMVIGIPMVVEHIVPIVAGGATTGDNLCLSCYRCNEFKGARQTAPDPDDAQVILLFHPRHQHWSEHFAWEDGNLHIRGLTPHGRTTVALLKLNSDWLVQARRLWIIAGVHPPLGELHSS
jgi:hypothetical protein